MQRAFLPFLFLSLGLTVSQASAQVVASDPEWVAVSCKSFSGNITHHSKPLAGASVVVEGTNIILTTNEAGFFNVPGWVKALPVLSVSANGYAPQSFTYTSCGAALVEMQELPNPRAQKGSPQKEQAKRSVLAIE